jgi:hypothetical protein
VGRCGRGGRGVSIVEVSGLRWVIWKGLGVLFFCRTCPWVLEIYYDYYCFVSENKSYPWE